MTSDRWVNCNNETVISCYPGTEQHIVNGAKTNEFRKRIIDETTIDLYDVPIEELVNLLQKYNKDGYFMSIWNYDNIVIYHYEYFTLGVNND
jgi:hypothetical protein